MEGLYMTFITLTTIGYGEVHGLSTAGRLFTILIAFIGIGCVAFVAARWARILIAGQIIRQRQLMRRIKKMRDHYIVCGYGRIGKHVADELHEAGKSIVVLEREKDLVRAMRDAGIAAVRGDATNEDTLLQAGITHARGLIALLPEDSENVFVTLMARELNPENFILARVTDIRNRRKLLQAGATQVVAPYSVGAIRMVQSILRPRVDRFMAHVLKADDVGLIMEEVRVEQGAFLAGKTLTEARFRQHFDTIVITIVKGSSEKMLFNPGPHDRIDAGDLLIVLGSQDMILRLERNGCAATEAEPNQRA